jgi:hypothetical protein
MPTAEYAVLLRFLPMREARRVGNVRTIPLLGGIPTPVFTAAPDRAVTRRSPLAQHLLYKMA